MTSVANQITSFINNYPPSGSLSTIAIFFDTKYNQSGFLSALVNPENLSTSSAVIPQPEGGYKGVIGGTAPGGQYGSSFSVENLSQLNSYLLLALSNLGEKGYVYLVNLNMGTGSVNAYQRIKYTTSPPPPPPIITTNFFNRKFLDIPYWAWMVIISIIILVLFIVVGIIEHRSKKAASQNLYSQF